MRELVLVCVVSVLAVLASMGVGLLLIAHPEVAVSGGNGSVVWVD